MVKVISKNDLYKEKEKFESEIIKKVNAELKGCFYTLLAGKTIAVDMADLDVKKANSDVIIDYFNNTNEWQVDILADESSNKQLFDVLTFKLI
jgi:hypothetical protein